MKKNWQHSSSQFEDKVNLMTFHSAKGLEFTACFLVGLEDHIIPHEKSLAEGSLEEERMAHVRCHDAGKKISDTQHVKSKEENGKGYC